jgi:general stress protein YciG
VLSLIHRNGDVNRIPAFALTTSRIRSAEWRVVVDSWTGVRHDCFSSEKALLCESFGDVGQRRGRAPDQAADRSRTDGLSRKGGHQACSHLTACGPGAYSPARELEFPSPGQWERGAES